MNPSDKMHILLSALVFLAGTWWLNGRDDTWLYVLSGSIAVSSLFYIAPLKKEDQ